MFFYKSEVFYSFMWLPKEIEVKSKTLGWLESHATSSLLGIDQQCVCFCLGTYEWFQFLYFLCREKI